MLNKLLKKINGAFGYKLIEKRLFKNNRVLAKDTSLNMKILLKNIFVNNNIEQLIIKIKDNK